MAESPSRTLRVAVAGGVARVTLARPERRNPLSLAVLRDLGSALRDLAGDPACRVVVLAAEGPAFSAGHDLVEMTECRDRAFYEALFGACADVMEAIREMPQPVIARVHAIATAAGCQLVAACDLAIAADTARFATPGVDIGLFCSTPMVPLVRAVGRKRALEMLFTGTPIDAPTAAAWGLVNRAVAAADLDAEVDALARTIASKNPAIVGLGKRAFHAQDGLPEADAYAVATAVMVDNALLDDAHEGMRAFLEKRPVRRPGV
jgi:enoyl-CoA hydratase/carnithine racemase